MLMERTGAFLRHFTGIGNQRPMLAGMPGLLCVCGPNRVGLLFIFVDGHCAPRDRRYLFVGLDAPALGHAIAPGREAEECR